jgi:hypothetical protein
MFMPQTKIASSANAISKAKPYSALSNEHVKAVVFVRLSLCALHNGLTCTSLPRSENGNTVTPHADVVNNSIHPSKPCFTIRETFHFPQCMYSSCNFHNKRIS